MSEAKKKLKLKKKKAAPAADAKSVKSSAGKVATIRGRVTQREKIAKRMRKAGTSSIDVATAVFNVEVIDTAATSTYEGQLLQDKGAVVVFRHKKSPRGGSKMRVSQFPRASMISLYGEVGEAASITVRQPRVVVSCKGTVEYDKGVMVVTSVASGEVTRVNLGQPNTIVNVFVDELASSSKSSKKGALKKRKAPVDDESFEDDED